ncbi:3506_t:CDS:1, partial [Racocetra fulgida]
RLAVHLDGRHNVTFQDEENLQNVANRNQNHITTLTAWFQKNIENSIAHIYTYVDFPSYYTWNSSRCKWTPRKTSTTMIGRLYMVQPSEGERYYLQTLLTHVKGAIGFDNLKTINSYTCNNFKEVCSYLGLLQNDTEWDACLLEASAVQTGHQLQQLFATILLFCQLVKPELLWDNHKVALCEDILYQAHVQLQDLDDASDIPTVIEHEALTQLENILLLSGKSLKDFPDMPIPPITSNISNNEETLNHLIREERSYNITNLQAELQPT